MLNSNWPQQKAGAMTVLSEAKQKGIIRAHGVSCHDLGALKVAADSDWVDVDLARLNPAGVAMDADPATIISILRTNEAAREGDHRDEDPRSRRTSGQTRRGASIRPGAGRARLLHDRLREPARAAGFDDADPRGQHARLNWPPFAALIDPRMTRMTRISFRIARQLGVRI
jgi:hypothetical protein